MFYFQNKFIITIKKTSYMSLLVCLLINLTGCNKKPETETLDNQSMTISTPEATTTVTTLSASTNAENNQQPSETATIELITQATQTGTPEDTLKKSMHALMNGSATEAASYYHINMPDFDKILEEQQPILKQKLKHLEIIQTEYNTDKTKAIIIGKMSTTDSQTPKDVGYKLQKIDGEWKLME